MEDCSTAQSIDCAITSYQHGAYASVTRGRRVFGLLLDVCRRASTGAPYGHDIDREGDLVYHLHGRSPLSCGSSVVVCDEKRRRKEERPE